MVTADLLNSMKSSKQFQKRVGLGTGHKYFSDKSLDPKNVCEYIEILYKYIKIANYDGKSWLVVRITAEDD